MAESLLKEIMVDNFPNLVSRSRRYPIGWIKRDSHRDIIKLLKVQDKERISKAVREKQLVTYKGTPVSRFFSRNFENQKGMGWHSQSAERKNCQSRMLYPAKLSIKIREVCSTKSG